MTEDPVSRGRELFAQCRWTECHAVLSTAERAAPLPGADLGLLAQSAYLIGREDDSIELTTRTYQRLIAERNSRGAARVAFWLAFMHTNRGETTRAGGWAARARRLVHDEQLGGAEEGLVLALEAHDPRVAADPERALELARRSLRLGQEAGDADVIMLSRLNIAWAELTRGERHAAMAQYDELMVAISAGEASPIVAGLGYCAVIAVCMGYRDLRRAEEWTAALTGWCEKQPDLVPYRGQCLVHRAQLMQLRGAWPAALGQATQARELLPDQQVGTAYYQLAELHRLTGRYEQAEQDYRRANAKGRQPEPGLSLLRIAQGRADAATVTLRRLCTETRSAEDRAELLAAYVSALLKVPDLAAARAACEELSHVVADLDAPLLSAVAAGCRGALLLAMGDPQSALPALRESWLVYHELDLPHHGAQVRVLIGLCLQRLADADAAALEFAAAREVFRRLDAQPDLAALDEHPAGRAPTAAGGLTGREIEVVRLVAAGRTNRAIAGELFLSEKTVARHLSNIYAKLDVSSRTAAAAYAYEHGLV